MVKGRKKPIYDSDDGVFDDALISHQKTQSFNGPRDQTGILSKDARKRPTDKNLESVARGMSRVGKGKKNV